MPVMHPIAALGIPTPQRTPLVRMKDVWIKSEAAQWTGSAKYRMVVGKIERAVQRGEITSDTTLAEVTAGSTGIALAYVGRLLGVPVEVHAYESISPSKRGAIEDFGARLVLHPSTSPVAKILEQVRSKKSRGRYWHLDQYDRGSVVDAYRPLGQELVDQLRREAKPVPQVFLCPVGTGGLIQGVGQVLRSNFPGIRIVALEPKADSSIEGTRNTQVVHQGPTDSYDSSFPDETIRVPCPGRLLVVGERRLGESSTAAVQAAASKEWGPTIVLAPD